MSKPFFEKKDVILCRSGIQLYRRSELRGLRVPMPPKVEKDVYAVYRPKKVVRAAKELCQMLPITREHPPNFVSGSNWKHYAQGYTGEQVEEVSVGDGEIGLKSKLVFSTDEIWDYYNKDNKEVSLGYECTNKWVDDPDTLGYDIELVSIDTVNHCAITARGRGGRSVAILDSLKRVSESFSSGIFHVARKMSGVMDDNTTLSDFLVGAMTCSEEFSEYYENRITSCLKYTKDCVERDALISFIADALEDKETFLENKDSIVSECDDLFEKLENRIEACFFV